ncbi:Glycosyltransferase [Oryctes borbonicus]|uniref:Glycosyltransferase n=1 Tax=Oryctes borbonicus TaxID=1629725 RepID=A0A0T6BCY2_9SCAR|nr:Glycosyltransferase [Oryctes borbonicus]
MRLLYFALLLVSVQSGDSANILAIAPFGGKSHYSIIEKLLKALVARGHEVDVISHFPSKTPIPRYNEFSVRGSLPIYQDNMTIDSVRDKNLIQQLTLIFANGGVSVCEAIFNTKIAQDLRNSTKKYDLLITHYFATNCMLAFAHLFSVPSVAVITSVSLPWAPSLIGLPDNPAYIPNYFTMFLPKMGFGDRFFNTMTYIITKIGFEVQSNKQSNAVVKKFFGPQLPDLDDLARNVSLVLVNSHFSTHQSRPVVPNFVEVAGLHIDGNATLTKHYEEILKTDTKIEGIIYLSFGSMIVTESFSEEVLLAFFNAFKRLPYKVLWKASRERFPKHLKLPNNIQFEPWMPQMEILCMLFQVQIYINTFLKSLLCLKYFTGHPNVKLFVSHGGMLGTSEALYCGVPVLGIPIFADQLLNIRNSVSKGVAIEIPYNQITEEKLVVAIQSLLNDPTFKTNTERVSRLFKDRPMSALDTAVYWVEYVIRHNGAPHLRSIAADLPWYQYYLLDVIFVFIVCVSTFCFVLCKLVIYIVLKLLVALYKNKIKKE